MRGLEVEKRRLEAEGIGFAFHVVQFTQDILIRLKKLVEDGLVNVAASQGELKPGPSIPLRTGPSIPLRTGPSIPLRTGFVVSSAE